MFDWLRRMDSKVAGTMVVAVGIAAGLLAWSLERLAGADLQVERSGDISNVGAGDVIVAALIAGFAAWAVAALLVNRGWSRWWPFVGSAALSLSTIGPNYLADDGSAVWLVVMHFAVGIVLITGFAAMYPGAWCGPHFWQRQPHRVAHR